MVVFLDGLESIIVLLCISIMSKDDENFLEVFASKLHVFFSEIFIQLLNPCFLKFFLSWIVCFLDV